MPNSMLKQKTEARQTRPSLSLPDAAVAVAAVADACALSVPLAQRAHRRPAAHDANGTEIHSGVK